MLDKFQEQYLFASVEELENIKKQIDKTIKDIKSINPKLFSYPKQAKYISGKFDSTICEEEWIYLTRSNLRTSITII